MSAIVSRSRPTQYGVHHLRELNRGLQAQVTLAGDTSLGYCTVLVQASSPAVAEALAELKRVIEAETRELVAAIIEKDARTRG